MFLIWFFCRMWEDVVIDVFFMENVVFVKCFGCKVVFEKVMGVFLFGVVFIGVLELDRIVFFIEFDNEGW